MPELLVVYSLMMYQQSLTMSLVALFLGITSRLVCYTAEKSLNDKLKLKQLNTYNKEII
tara:strand:+ start:2250 stop:2426 length:177 start_codon:yes stop_codon:yes gene_type:complete